MFSLMLLVVGLTLAGALAAAAILYAGSSSLNGKASAEAASLLGQSSQIVSASTAYANDHYGEKPGTLATLVDEQYLSTTPPGWLDPQGGEIRLTSKPIDSARACELFNLKQNIVGIPRCSSLGDISTPVCCQ